MTTEERKEYMKLYRQKNKQKISEQKKEWKKNNPEKVKQHSITSYANNIEKRKEYDAKRSKTTERINQIQEWRKANKNDISKKRKERYQKNKDRENKNNTIYYKKRRETDPLFRFRTNLRTSIKTIFRKKGFTSKQTTKILGCTFDYFKEQIESLWLDWMNWDNYGLYNGTENYGWDIDHIIPISSAKTIEELIKLNHYTNLQPLCSKINRDVKKNKIL